MPSLPPGLKLLTTAVRALAGLGIVAALISTPLMLLNTDWLMLQARHMVTGLDPALIVAGDRMRWLTVLGTLPGTALWLFALWQTWCLFGDFAGGRFFELDTLRHFRQFARAIFGMGLLGPVEDAWMSVAVTSSHPSGEQMLVVGFGSHDLMSILIGAALLAIAVVMTRAASLAEENAGFV